ncbi:ABC transporter ATP-binding protein [Streptacidiphilus sp. PB12-B1b]|uniref:ATP-binding cassette domain-containing protein n=1 Tax=Streptacidiphilus sp. PB12-B1b TaxID=2705012 RepID=UPI0015FBD1C4|nr:ABC transporter ATP-binding protein [Streptacidiphilus sp. PB12-B1b]QMU77035.1 ABC transporter ATP-binding protein [Streptacidiphilus sp. PB12-B1b]
MRSTAPPRPLPPRSGAPGARADLRPADRLLRRVARRQPRWPLTLAAAVLAGTAATLALPITLARGVNGVLAGRSTGPCLPFFVTLAVLVAAETLTQLADPYTTAGATAFLRSAFVRHTLAAGPFAAELPSTGDLVARLTGSTAEAATAAPSVVYSLSQLALSVGAVVALGLLDPLLAVTFLVTAPACYLLVRGYLRRTTGLVVGYQQGQAAVAARLLDALAGIRTIAASGTVDAEIERVLQPVPQLSRSGRALWDGQRRIAWYTSLLAPATQVAVLAVAGYGVATGGFTPGGLVAALGYATVGLSFFGNAQSLLGLARARAGASRLASVLDRLLPTAGMLPLPPGPGRLEFRAVSVRRSGTTVLDRLELTVPAGQCLALVGRSGSGKSLLAALAGRLLDPDEGAVLLDGAPLERVDPRELRAAVAYAFADPRLCGATVEEAVAPVPETAATGQPEGEPASALVCEALRAMQAEPFVSRLPEGARTALDLAPMSGGERQRLGLARALAQALAAGSRLLVLDDATSSLDTAAEAQVGRALERLLGDRTRLVVTHRAGVAARADAVAWLEDGRVRAVAPHAELWHLADYRALFHHPED